ncbi:FecR domain-containing protein [Chitinophaga caseinilytica]|uniref:FecR family protein n=1 Tax=Chitinophaga caseinilytica TaxID=2267521 RepID=UPI003C2AEA69
MMTNEERITRLLAARLAGEASDADLRELENLLAQDPSQQSRAQLIQRYCSDTPIHASADTEQALTRLLDRIRSNESHSSPNFNTPQNSDGNRVSESSSNIANANRLTDSSSNTFASNRAANNSSNTPQNSDVNRVADSSSNPFASDRQSNPSSNTPQNLLSNLHPNDPSSNLNNFENATGNIPSAGPNTPENTTERMLPSNTGSPEISVASRKGNAWKWWSAAATAALLIGCAWALWGPSKTPLPNSIAFQPETDTLQWLHRQNGKAIRAVLELADGSKIWLNADSKLSYPEQFGPRSREVFLTGEAFFQVASSPQKPFIVHLSKGTIRVLGTSFNVRAYDNEPVQTSVSTGKVAFIPKYDDARAPDTFYITPDEKVTWHHEGERPEKSATSGDEDRAWTDGGLVFRDASLEEICRELERTFGKKVQFNSDAPRYYRMTGAFRNNSLPEILFYLSRSKNFRYTITDSTLLISE